MHRITFKSSFTLLNLKQPGKYKGSIFALFFNPSKHETQLASNETPLASSETTPSKCVKQVPAGILQLPELNLKINLSLQVIFSPPCSGVKSFMKMALYSVTQEPEMHTATLHETLNSHVPFP